MSIQKICPIINYNVSQLGVGVQMPNHQRNYCQFNEQRVNEILDAIKDVIVNKENAKSELGLKKRLVEVEINNFKAKKLSAINPLIDNFNSQFKAGKSKEELKKIAENILIEIKNGSPYVYS